MLIISYLIWILGASLTITYIYGIRKYAQRGLGVSRQTVITTMLWTISLIVIPLTGISIFNYFWIFPLSWLLGQKLSAFFPFSPILFIAPYFATIYCIGVSKIKIKENITIINKYNDLISEIAPNEMLDKNLKFQLLPRSGLSPHRAAMTVLINDEIKLKGLSENEVLKRYEKLRNNGLSAFDTLQKVAQEIK